MLNEAYVFTSKGLEFKSHLTRKDKVYERSGYNSLMYSSYFRQQYIQEFQDGLDDIVFSLSTEHIQVVDGIEADKKWKDRFKLQVDDWIFHPWIKPSLLPAVTSKIDMSKYTDNYKTLDSIYVFTDELLDIAKHFHLSPQALKEILTREAAEYNHIIPDVIKYIEEHYCSFKDLPTYVKNNCTFKMPRYLQTETKEFIHLLAAYCNGEVEISNSDFKVRIRNIQESKSNPIYKLLQTLNVKTVKVGDDILVLNKPFHQLLSKCIQFSLQGLRTFPLELQELFISLVKEDREVNMSVRLALQLKEFLYFHKKVLRLAMKNEALVVTVHSQSIPDLLVVEEDGYYTQLISVSEEKLSPKTAIETESKYLLSTSYLSRNVK